MEDDRHGKRNKEYTNGEITVYWKPLKCIHVTTCYRELIEVFNPRKRPWIDMNGAPTEEIIRVVNLCPTGALSLKYNKDIESAGKTTSGINREESEKKPEFDSEIKITNTKPETEVRVMKNGPLVVKGRFTIVSSSGGTLKQMKMVSFCRCGHSKKMPFCDGTHREINFTSE